ncbi:ribosome silencing factor [Polaromonas sp.]|uniref:ribosome silencing factor n=1 Tax=Polaromonas sp. TaxID=1869339 RepID=UPI0013B72B2F|nr:ribosome silencing factor [Polaromonas sp.]NDP63679.1 ribosome silencing factor [Polaromonas sp.]
MTPTTVKTSSTEGKKDVQKLQRAIIDGLEDVKAQDIQVFDTEHITSLFERVIVASGTSNRQTKALAASVRDAVRDAGFAKPRIEGEDNGEWIIVDCGAAVAHIMQPTIRQYYNLEELWGDKPIKLKLGAPTPLPKASKVEVKAEVKPARSPAAAGGKSKSPAKPSKAAKVIGEESLPDAATLARTDDGTYVGRVGKTHDWTAKRNATAPAAEPEAKPIKARKPSSRVAPAESKPVTAKTAAKKVVVKTPVVKIPVAKKVAAQQAAVKTAVKKPAAKKSAAKKTTTRSE